MRTPPNEPFGLLEPDTAENAPVSLAVRTAISCPLVVRPFAGLETVPTKILTPFGMLLNTAFSRVPQSAKPGVLVLLAAPEG